MGGVIFAGTHELVMRRAKVQTRRLWKADDEGWWFDPVNRISSCSNEMLSPRAYIEEVVRNSRRLWKVGHTYAVQAGRGQTALGRIRILSIRLEPLQYIDDFDAQLELGYEDVGIGEFRELWDSLQRRAADRWLANPKVWALSFRLVAVGGQWLPS
jgi:hypothetical protein